MPASCMYETCLLKFYYLDRKWHAYPFVATQPAKETNVVVQVRRWFCTKESDPSLQCAHVMAMAVQKIFPDAKVTIGPWIENGFYYDFDMEPLTDKDLKRIKKEMVSNSVHNTTRIIIFD